MFCRKCGKEVPNSARFCHHCGIELYPNSVSSPKPPPMQTKSEQDKPKPRIKITKQAVAVIALVCLVLGMFYAVSPLYSRSILQNNANSVMYLEVYDKSHDLIGTASGFFIKNGKTLVTNYHVIQGANSISVISSSGESFTSSNTVLAYDVKSDLAILECDTDLGIKPLKLSDSNTVKQGDVVYAVGYPLGLSNTMSDGIVSSRYFDDYGVDVLQITAAISPGSSGGALFNEKGLVIGVTSAFYDGGQNLNIAIAANTVQELYSKNSAKTALSTLNK